MAILHSTPPFLQVMAQWLSSVCFEAFMRCTLRLIVLWQPPGREWDVAVVYPANVFLIVYEVRLARGHGHAYAFKEKPECARVIGLRPGPVEIMNCNSQPRQANGQTGHISHSAVVVVYLSTISLAYGRRPTVVVYAHTFVLPAQGDGTTQANLLLLLLWRLPNGGASSACTIQVSCPTVRHSTKRPKTVVGDKNRRRKKPKAPHKRKRPNDRRDRPNQTTEPAAAVENV
ncbi:hypothetical protein ZHAS_00005837 [Anopheles sinensis]|uniref:Uncharacterized protein n=1 Tax=Anopheles sinensis TaxID=74873 RepID=A0A084VKR5_ANOSI|nr:hypothetical protein ZHAS_00005837 [Anopheles sinensis]